jgi:hypothetical protein
VIARPEKAWHGEAVLVRWNAKCAGCAALLLVSSFAFGACSSRSGNAPSQSASQGEGAGEDGGGVVGCSGEGDTYVANLAKAGKLGKYTFTLTKAVPAPPDLNGNVWTLTVKDVTGASPALDQLQVLPFMPQMGHGSDQTPQIAANTDGTFDVSDIDLFMDGLWTVTFTVTEPPAEDAGSKAPLLIDQGVFTFCING